YRDPQAFGDLVLADFTALIDELFPEGTVPDALEREAAKHHAFAAHRSQLCVGRQTQMAQLDAFVKGDGAPLVVLAEPGLGKSTLLAAWAVSHRASSPETLILENYVGASEESANWTAMLRRIMRELDRRLDLGLQIPDAADVLPPAFADALAQAARRCRVVL